MNSDKEILKEKNRLLEIVKDINLEKKDSILGLIDNLSFMKVQLQKYMDDMNKNGTIELFSQSPNQKPYERVRPVVKEYNSMLRNYHNAVKQFMLTLPKDDTEEIDDGFEELVNR